MEIAQRLAATLKGLRQRLGWSLAETAARTGVSKAMLGQIERQESSPTVATLWKLATGFGVAFTALLGDPAAGGHTPTAPMVATPLFDWDPLLAMDYLAVQMAPGAESTSSPHQAGVIEHVVVIAGRLRLTLPDGEYLLAAGEGQRFAGDVVHRYANPGPEPLLFHSLIHYPGGKNPA